MPSLTSSLTHRRDRGHRWRWIVLIAAALLAVTWRAQSAARTAPRQQPLGGGFSPRSGGAATLDRAESAAPTSKRTDDASKPSTTSQAESAPADQPELETATAASTESVNQTTDSNAPRASSEAPEVVPAGEDEGGTFRPTRAVTDAYGVVVTGTAPAGLDGEAKWVQGNEEGHCPDDYPIKGNASSRIYHMPGESSYERTIPEYCFASEEDAAEAGFRPRAR